ncbi:MAG: ATP-binding protein [Gammaproteobacteria bacterium]|nr:PAS domain-containing protein [Pseudomonadales bacterium]MCP5331224.1 PAS domain-containing protein [Pseudomonadales bacterium]
MAAVANSIRTQQDENVRPFRPLQEVPLELNSPEALNLAFRAFNELSSELSAAYELLQARVGELTREVELANVQRLQEISEKERIASRLENLLQLLPGGVIVLNSSGQVSDCNAAAIELLGEPLKGLYWRDIIAERFAPRLDDGHEISLRNGKRVSLATRSLQDEPGQIILLTDQTETRQLQQDLSRHQRLSAMGKMVSSLAHQIRTPLSAAMLYAGQLRNPQLTQEQSNRFTDRLMSRLHNMERQVKDMLIFARGDAVLDETITIDALFDELQIASEMLTRSGFDCQWHTDCPQAQIRCNRESLIGAMLNLIENALQAAGEHASLQIHAHVDDAGDVMIWVQDNGPGIPESLREQITEAFFTTRAQGTGLGLSVAQVVAKAHKGRFFIESDCEHPGQTGTRAGFVLPVASDAVSMNRIADKQTRLI